MGIVPRRRRWNLFFSNFWKRSGYVGVHVRAMLWKHKKMFLYFHVFHDNYRIKVKRGLLEVLGKKCFRLFRILLIRSNHVGFVQLRKRNYIVWLNLHLTSWFCYWPIWMFLMSKCSGKRLEPAFLLSLFVN